MKKRILTTVLVGLLLSTLVISVSADSMDDSNNTETYGFEIEKTRILLLERALEPKEPYAAVQSWAEGIKTRNGALQYAVMAQNLKDEYYPIFTELGWVTGVSSPWVESYEIAEKYRIDNDKYRYKVVFTFTDSTKSRFSEIEYVTVKYYDNIWLVSSIEEVNINPSLEGISLGDSSQSVISILGSNCIKTDEPDSAGYIGEDTTVWRYESGISVTIGKTSDKVLRIASVSPDFKTDLGIKVSEDINTVYEAYKPLYEEAVSRHSDEVLEGWFLVGNEAVIIFDFNKSDNAVVNSNITPDSKVEEIIVAYWKHFD